MSESTSGQQDVEAPAMLHLLVVFGSRTEYGPERTACQSFGFA